VYYSALPERQVDVQLAHDLIAAFLVARQAPPALLAREIVEALDKFDALLLDEVEKAIRARRNAVPISESSPEQFYTSATLSEVLPLGTA
jgi:hypothetical protein